MPDVTIIELAPQSSGKATKKFKKHIDVLSAQDTKEVVNIGHEFLPWKLWTQQPNASNSLNLAMVF